jgi:hypothetical protein
VRKLTGRKMVRAAGDTRIMEIESIRWLVMQEKKMKPHHFNVDKCQWRVVYCQYRTSYEWVVGDGQGGPGLPLRNACAGCPTGATHERCCCTIPKPKCRRPGSWLGLHGLRDHASRAISGAGWFT